MQKENVMNAEVYCHVGKLDNSRHAEVNIVGNGKSSACDFLPQSNSSGEEAMRKSSSLSMLFKGDEKDSS